MKPGRVAAVVVGVVLALPALALFLGGAALTVAYATERDDGGYFDKTLERLSTPTAVITTGEADLGADPGPPDRLLDFVDVSVRIRATGIDEGSELFIGIGAEADVETYLSGVARDEIRDVETDGDVKYRSFPGTESPALPAEQGFWVASASGPGTQELVWDVAEGSWAAVLMNADASPGILAEVTVGIRSGALLPVGLAMLIAGALLLVVAVAIMVVATRGGAGKAIPAGEVLEAGEAPPVLWEEPVLLEASIDSPLSQWLWLVKWFLAIPHFIVLAFLWLAFVLLTVISGVVILFTGRYPRGIFDFNVGVLRWTWRVLFYAGPGGLGTDRYPPFTTDEAADYSATLDVEYPEELSRGLVLVKWWLLAIPHYLVVALIAGGGAGWWWRDDWGKGGLWSGGLVALLVLIAAVVLLFSGRYPRPLFDLIIGLNRWVFRVVAYASLMTDRYPPFRLDQGGQEPRPTRETQEPGEA